VFVCLRVSVCVYVQDNWSLHEMQKARQIAIIKARAFFSIFCRKSRVVVLDTIFLQKQSKQNVLRHFLLVIIFLSSSQKIYNDGKVCG